VTRSRFDHGAKRASRRHFEESNIQRAVFLETSIEWLRDRLPANYDRGKAPIAHKAGDEMKRILAALFTALMLAATAQAAAKEALPSEALQVARAAGFNKIRDYTARDAQAAAKLPTRESGSAATMGAIGAGTAAGVFTPPKGLSSGTAAGLSLAGAFLLSLPVAYPELSPRFLAWMPKDLAATPEAATEALSQILMRAIAQSVPESRVEMKVRDVEKNTMIRRYIAVDEPRCRDCKLWALGFDLGREPKIGKAPSFLGGSNAYVWGRPGFRGEGNFTGYPWTAPEMTADDRIEVLRSISSKLPAWMYLYVPPDQKLAPYPQMFHQGRILLFVEPGVE
jgi:hypothetical protein